MSALVPGSEATMSDPSTWYYTGWVVWLAFGIGLIAGLIAGLQIGRKQR